MNMMTKRYRQDEQYKTVLESNRYLLSKNIIHTPELHSRLVSDKVVTETMLKDIQEGKSQQEMNDRLINVLKLRNKTAYRKFTSILLLSGHSLLADFLHDDEQTSAHYVKAGEIERRIPSVAACLGLDDMKRLCHYIDSKVKGEIAKKTWNGSARERDRIEEIRKDLFFKEAEKQRSLDKSHQKVLELENSLKQLTKEKEEREQDISNLKFNISQMEKDHKDNLSKQIRFNTANNSTILKLSDRLVQYTGHIGELTTKLQQSVNEIFMEQEMDYVYRYAPRTLSEFNKGKADDRRKLAELDSVVSRLLRIAQNFNDDLKSLDNNRTQEREIILALLGSRDNEISTSEALKLFVAKENKEKQQFLKDIQATSTLLKNGKVAMQTQEVNHEAQSKDSQPTVDFRTLRSSLGMVREEIQHISKRLQWKDAQIRALEEENSELKTGVFFRTGRVNQDPQLESTSPSYPEVTSPPLKHKTPNTKKRHSTGKKTKAGLSNKRKQRVLSPIEETPGNKSNANHIVFPALDNGQKENTKVITSRA